MYFYLESNVPRILSLYSEYFLQYMKLADGLPKKLFKVIFLIKMETV